MKTKRQRLLLLLSFFSLSVAAQTNTEGAVSLGRLNILSPGLGYELRTARFQTAFLQGGFSPSFATVQFGSNGNDLQFYFDPLFSLQYRFYYNGPRRLEAGKSIARNSMNYVALLGETSFSRRPLSDAYPEESKRRTINRIGLLWGLQRNLPSRLSVDLNAGLGYLFSYGTLPGGTVRRNIGQVSLLSDITLGIWLGKK